MPITIPIPKWKGDPKMELRSKMERRSKNGTAFHNGTASPHPLTRACIRPRTRSPTRPLGHCSPIGVAVIAVGQINHEMLHNCV